ncbi:MAG: hypothetical protein ABIF71_03305 [Planctomycetota bacterium]
MDIKKVSVKRYTINGRTHDRLDDVPAEFRDLLDQAAVGPVTGPVQHEVRRIEWRGDPADAPPEIREMLHRMPASPDAGKVRIEAGVAWRTGGSDRVFRLPAWAAWLAIGLVGAIIWYSVSRFGTD